MDTIHGPVTAVGFGFATVDVPAGATIVFACGNGGKHEIANPSTISFFLSDTSVSPSLCPLPSHYMAGGGGPTSTGGRLSHVCLGAVGREMNLSGKGDCTMRFYGARGDLSLEGSDGRKYEPPRTGVLLIFSDPQTTRPATTLPGPASLRAITQARPSNPSNAMPDRQAAAEEGAPEGRVDQLEPERGPGNGSGRGQPQQDQ